MQDLARSLEARVNDLFCGYIRQPIKVEKANETQYLISGGCVLYDKYCSKVLPATEDGTCPTCIKYRQYFNLK